MVLRGWEDKGVRMTVYERGSFKINRADDREELIKILANPDTS